MNQQFQTFQQPTPPQQESVFLNRLRFRMSGTYADQVFRPYDCHLDYNNTARFGSRIMELNGGNMDITNPTILSGLSGEIMQPLGTPTTMVNIANGWDTQRLRFMLDITTRKTEQGYLRYILIGYTGYADLSFGKQLDPNMPMWINSIIPIRGMLINTVNGPSYTEVIEDVQHLMLRPALRPEHVNKFQPMGGFGVMTPEKVFNRLMANGMPGKMVLDFRNGFGQEGMYLASTANGISNHYLQRSMSALASSKYYADEDSGPGSSKFYEYAAQSAADPSVYENEAMVFLKRRTNLGTLRYMTLQELVNIWPSIGDPNSGYMELRPEPPSQIEGFAPSIRGYSSNMTDCDAETVVATQAMFGVQALFARSGIQRGVFELSNDTINLQPIFRWRDADSLTSNDLTNGLTRAQNTICAELMPDLTMTSTRFVTLTLEYDILGETRMRISINRQAYKDYTIPTFADSNFAPYMTHDMSYVDQLANGITGITLGVEHMLRPSPNFVPDQSGHGLVVDPMQQAMNVGQSVMQPQNQTNAGVSYADSFKPNQFI